MTTDATSQSAGTLSPGERRTLAAVVARVLDGARELAPALDPMQIVENRLERAPPHLRADMLRVLDLFGSRLAALVTLGVPRPFAALDAARQDRMLERWACSRLGAKRTVFQALRRFAIAAWYSRPEVQRALGYRGPFHQRTPALPWEGAALGRSSDAEPIARRDDAALVAPPIRSDALPRATIDSGSPLARDAARRGRVVAGRALGSDLRLTADAVVIGSGAGGAVVAARLAEAGLEVIVLESGGLWTASDFTEREGEMTERLYADQALRSTEDLGVSLFQGDTVGGSTTVNWLAMLRTPDHVRDEWAQRFGLVVATSPAFDAALDRVWSDVHARVVPDDAHSANNRLLLDGARALGWSARAIENNARGCVRSGFCGQGCRYDAKQGTLLTYVPRALAANATVYADAAVERIQLLGGRHARTVKRVWASVRGAAGATHTVTVDAPVVVVAAGAVGTPALLQRSALGGGAVGRWLRLHPTTAVIARYDREIQAGTGAPLTVICDEFARGANGYGFWLETPPAHPALAAVALSGFGRAHAEQGRDYARLGAIIALVRDGADVERSSGSVRVDRSGRTRIRYRLGRTDARHLAAGIVAAVRVHLAAGAREVRTLHTSSLVARSERDLAAIAAASTKPNDVTVFSAHVNGTCRLGRDARTSGAHSDDECLGERHGVPGVYVADGSLVPTGIGVNPQGTIMALAHLVADGILARAPR